MRKKNSILLWSSYFDSTKTRTGGRKVSKNLAVSSPKIEELQSAAKRLGLQPEVNLDAAYPSCPWKNVGYIVLPKTEAKTETIKKIAKELSILRR
ncbi:MAG: signal recognition particle subunit SRP19/SEC65 family protein [archaeon]|nr:signal recognition particle protein Srp19 [Candidatus Bathyarchaeum sp.]